MMSMRHCFALYGVQTTFFDTQVPPGAGAGAAASPVHDPADGHHGPGERSRVQASCAGRRYRHRSLTDVAGQAWLSNFGYQSISGN